MGGTSAAANARHARCLVRALCLLLRKVSLHALLQGAAGGSRGAAATASGELGGLEGAGAEVDAAEVRACRTNFARSLHIACVPFL